MAVDSGTYTDDVLYRRRQIAQQLADLNKQPIQHPLQGFAQLAGNFMAGKEEADLKQEQRDNEAKGTAALAQALGMPAPEAAPQGPRGIDRIASLLSGTGWTPPQQGGVQPPQNSQAMHPPSQSQDTPAFRGGLADRIVGAESNGVATARNPRSTAEGAGQFINSTWLATIKATRPDLANGKSDEQLLALRRDPKLSHQMTEAYAQQNGGVLRSAGLPVTPGTTYLAHFAGPQGAVGVLQANPNHPVEAILGSKVVAANPFLKGMTAGDLRAWADKKMGGGGQRSAEADLPAPGAQQAMVPGYSPPFQGGGQGMMMPPEAAGPGAAGNAASMQMPGGPAPLSARGGPQPGSDFAQGTAPALPYPLAASSRLPLPPPRPPGLDPASDMPAQGASPTGPAPAMAPPPFPLDGQPEGNMNVAQALWDARGGNALIPPPPTSGGISGGIAPPPQSPQPPPAAGLNQPTSINRGTSINPVQPGSAPSPSPAAAPVGGAGVSSPSAPPPSPAGQRDPRQIALALMASPSTRPMGMAIAQSLIAQQMKPPEYGFQSTPDGTILRTNPRTGQIEPAYQANLKPTYGVIGKDQFGNEQYGWIDPQNRSTTPGAMGTAASQAQGAQGQPGGIPPAPQGVDPKQWRTKWGEQAATDALPPDPDKVSALRKEVQQLPSYKNIAQAAPIYRAMTEAVGRDTKASDLNLVYGLGKIMDPTSVVREGEIVMANDTQGLADKLNGFIKGIQGEGRLRPEARAQIMQEAHGRMQSYVQMFDQDAGMYRGIAGRSRMNTADILPDFGKFEPYQPPAPATKPGPQSSPAAAPAQSPKLDALLKKYGG